MAVRCIHGTCQILQQCLEVKTVWLMPLEMINVVPNPYKAYSEYERNRIDSRVKITNLPRTLFNQNLLDKWKVNQDIQER